MTASKMFFCPESIVMVDGVCMSFTSFLEANEANEWDMHDVQKIVNDLILDGVHRPSMHEEVHLVSHIDV